MTLAVVWSDDATTDFLDILDYIAERNVAAADRLEALIQHAADRLPDHPYIHRPGRIAGTREAIVHPNYILVYRVAIHAIEVLAVLHARQRYP
ncbi:MULTISPECIES: type II toxin-antitoxin system RelE/ParE family toxin [Sphingomonas]|uniref:Type II toxin-antitoxin system mRNA interferase toxin, RelE/StbE family n=1 Tax=Sphingomonas kyungheensis TaxID=1069987 RepID=A0ABU8GXN7_9SPHN|nr:MULTISPECIES: type II toxin-antitoxin system mRNA interferase toxin, RelE/StbE family [unclassified Sphingomonas]EZP55509.1 Addiction module toxin, RelE/StbE family protein [Sphingomonas sp. RIT328]